MQNSFFRVLAAFLAAATLVFSQSTTNSTSNGWRRVGDPSAMAQQQAPYPGQDASQLPAPTTEDNQAPLPPSQGPASPAYPSQPPAPPNPSAPPITSAPPSTIARPPYQPPAEIPPVLQIPAGTYLTVRTNSVISSDQNHVGDGFSASLSRPLVVNGVVIAEPGQIITGQVVESQKAGRIEGLARLRLQLTELTLVDGQQLPIRTQLISRQANSSVGRDAGAVAGTTGLGAAIGAAAGWGTGAAIGAGAGAAVGVLGVLLTRGHPSVIYPEETLTFRLEAPLTVDTQRSSQAFRYVQPNEYNQPLNTQAPPPPSFYQAPVAPVVVAAPYLYGGPYGYGYPYYYGPGFYGPSFSFFYGRGYYGHGYYGRGWRR